MTAYGIDLGTTTTLIARATQGRGADTVEAQIIKVNGHSFIPSFAYFLEDGSNKVGTDAKKTSIVSDKTNSKGIVRAVKRLMGRSIIFPPPIDRTPAQVSALYLIEMLRESHFIGKDELTVTVPASFTSNQRRDTVEALRIACKQSGIVLADDKFKNLLISEPVAALLSFLAKDLERAEDRRQFNLDESPLVMVYDMGGGTLDLTVVALSWVNPHAPKSLSNVHFEVRELNRYNQFGGEDFDREIAYHLLNHLIETHPELDTWEMTDKKLGGIDKEEEPKPELPQVHYHMIDEAERLKRQLNTEISYALPGESPTISFDMKPLHLRGEDYGFSGWEISSDTLIGWLQPFLAHRDDPRNALYPIDLLLSRSGVAAADIRYFLTVGGMLHFEPLIAVLQQYWANISPNTTLLTCQPPDEAVATGAAVYSYLKSTQEKFSITEPAADAYYIRRANSFELIMERGAHTIGEKREFHLQSGGELLRLQIFAGESLLPGQVPESVYPSLIYQGGILVPLGKKYPRDTKVWIQMQHKPDDHTKMPSLKVWVETETNLIRDIAYNELQSE